MVKVENSFSLNDLKAVFLRPEVYDILLGDTRLPPDKIDLRGLITDPRLKWWLVYRDGESVGFHCFTNMNGVYWSVASGFIPGARGKIVLDSFKVALDTTALLFEVKKWVAEIPVDNKPSILMARKAGFKSEGVNARSFLRNGKLIDMVRLVKWSDE